MQHQLRTNPKFEIMGERENSRRAEGMADVLNGLARSRGKACNGLSLAIGAVAIASIITLAEWLWGRGEAYLFGLYLLGMAAAFAVHCWVRLEELRQIEMNSVAAATQAGFEVTQQKSSAPFEHRFSVSLAMPLQQYFEETPAKPSFAKPVELFAWSPGPLLAAIELPKLPAQGLSRAAYLFALEERINRLVAAEDESEARRLLKIVERYEPSVNTNDLKELGQAMVAASEWLHERHQFPDEGVPVELVQHDGDLLAYLQDDDSLEAFLQDVYATHEGDHV